MRRPKASRIDGRTRNLGVVQAPIGNTKLKGTVR